MHPLQEFLNTHFKEPTSDFEELGGGHFSQAFGFTHQGSTKVLRVADSDQDFLKDKLISEKLIHKDVPVPKVLEMGTYGEGQFFCITERCAGRTFDQLTLPEKEATIPAIFHALEAIHRLDISMTSGFGLIDLQGNGQFGSWAEHMLSLKNHKVDYDVAGIKARPYFDQALFDETYSKLEKLLRVIPEKRFFIHGDFGFDNLIIEGAHVTGVIDWAEARIGDPAYDAAWLDFWSDDISFAKVMLDQAASKGIHPAHIHERLLVCIYHIALSSLLFAAHRDDEQDYLKVIWRLKRAEGRFG